MKFRRPRLSFFLNALILLGVVACGGAGGSGDPSNSLDLESLAIANCPTQALFPGDKIALAVEGNPAGKAVAVIPDAFQSDRPRLAAVDAQGNLVALYPGEARVTATAAGLSSEACVVQILPPEHQGSVRRLTDNADEDHWGMNNSWPMTSRGKVLWQRIDGNLDIEVLLHDRRDPAGDDTSVDLVDFLSGDVDFMALGSGAAEGEVLLSYRVGLQDTHVSADGRAPRDLGDRQQEEGSIADGCYFFREGGGANDLQRFTAAAGLTEILSAGETYTPVGSGCEAVYERRGAAESELVHFDGQTHLPIADGLPAFPDFDFRRQRAVYASGGDVTLVDLTQDPPAVVPLTSDGPTRLDRNPRTDGESVVWHQIDGAEHHVWMYDIASGTRRKISATVAPKKFDSLQIDLKQALWVEGTELWFHAGSGDAADSAAVDLKGVPLDPGYRPYLKDGLVAYVGDDGDTEILIVE